MESCTKMSILEELPQLDEVFIVEDFHHETFQDTLKNTQILI